LEDFKFKVCLDSIKPVMNRIWILLFITAFASCKGDFTSNNNLQKEVDRLQHQLDNTYKPGLGEFMSSIQIHHAKLWFAGQHQNWKLADFEIHEIGEALDNIKMFNTDRPEIKKIGMITPAIDSVTSAIKKQDLQLFSRTYQTLTNTCNTCHLATDHGFNQVIIPQMPPISNQRF
jgi:hypothetical protein